MKTEHTLIALLLDVAGCFILITITLFPQLFIYCMYQQPILNSAMYSILALLLLQALIVSTTYIVTKKIGLNFSQL